MGSRLRVAAGLCWLSQGTWRWRGVNGRWMRKDEPKGGHQHTHRLLLATEGPKAPTEDGISVAGLNASPGSPVFRGTNAAGGIRERPTRAQSRRDRRQMTGRNAGLQNVSRCACESAMIEDAETVLKFPWMRRNGIVVPCGLGRPLFLPFRVGETSQQTFRENPHQTLVLGSWLPERERGNAASCDRVET